MGDYRFTRTIAAPPDLVFDLWTDFDRAHEWMVGLTKITEITGPVDQPGTRYTAWYSGMRSPNEILEVERPRLIRTRIGNWLLRGQTRVTIEQDGDGTRLTQEFTTVGLIPAIAAWIFSQGSYRGSFRGELNTFVAMAERAARSSG